MHVSPIDLPEQITAGNGSADSPERRAAFAAASFTKVAQEILTLLAPYRAGWLDADIAITAQNISFQMPMFEACKADYTAHEQMALHCHKEDLLPALRCFYDACLLHPLIGPFLQRGSHGPLKLRVSHQRFTLSFSTLWAGEKETPWRSQEDMAALIANTLTPPVFTEHELLFTEETGYSYIGRECITRECLSSFLSFLTTTPSDRIATWVNTENPADAQGKTVFTYKIDGQFITRLDIFDNHSGRSAMKVLHMMQEQEWGLSIAIPAKDNPPGLPVCAHRNEPL